MRALLTSLLLLLSSVIHATDVSGVISANTTWTLAASPYVLTGDIEVRALLTVEPGVQIKVSAAKGMKVSPAGRLVAIGTSLLPIVLTSVRDVPAGTPMAGDWGYLHIVSTAANALPSELRHFKMRFGKALKLEGASPLLRECVFEGQLEAAILMDLSSSPTGEALSATGNGVNGILVPAGELIGQARWSIRSLPYVVRGGLLHVGAKPLALQFERITLAMAPKATGMLRLTLADPAPTAVTVTLSSSATSVATAPATVSIAQDQYTVDVPITSLASGVAQITAAAPGMNSPTATITVAPLPSIFLFPSGATVGLNRSRQLYLSVNSPAPPGGLDVLLSASPSGRINAPTGLLLPNGGAGISFDVSGLSVGTTTLSASAAGYVGTQLSVEVVPLSMAFAGSVLVPIGTRNISLALSHAALAGGGSITLSSDNPAVLSVPATATYPGLSESVRIPMRGVTEGTATVTANSSEYGQTSTLVRVEKLIPSFTTAATRIPIGMTESYAIRLNGAAPNEALVFNLSSSDPAIASVTPATITIVPGQFYSTINAQIAVHAVGPVTITASNKTTQTATIGVEAVARGQFVFSEPSLVLGHVSQSQRVRVGIFAAGGLYYSQSPLDVQFSVSDPSKLTAELYNGGLRGNDSVVLTGLANTTTAVTVQAVFPDVLPATTPLSVTVVDPIVEFNDLDGVRGLAGGRDDFYLTWRVPGSSDIMQTPRANQTMALTVVDANPAGIIDGFYEAASGSTLANTISFSTATNRSATRFVGAPTALGEYKVRATSAAFGAFTSTEQSIRGFNLQFTRPSATLGKGMRSGFGAIAVQRRVGATPQELSTPLTVDLQISDPSRVGAPISVTIPGFASAASIDLTGLELTQAVTLIASAPAYTSGTALNIKVVGLKLEIVPQRPMLFTDGGRTRVDYQVGVPPGPDVITQYPLPSIVVGVSLQEMMPANVVAGIYANYEGGAPISSVSVNFSSGEIFAYIGEPSAAGSLKLRASIVGNVSSPWTSELIPILVNQVQLQEPSYAVIKGLKQGVRAHPLGPVVVTWSASLTCTQSSICTVTPPFINQNTQFNGFELFGLELGGTSMTLQTTPATLGTQVRPVQVVPLAMTFDSYDHSSCTLINRRFSGANYWRANFDPQINFAPQNLDVAIELVDQSPPNAASLDSTPQQLEIRAGESSTDPQQCEGFGINYNAVGTYRFRATIPGVGVFTSTPQSTAFFAGNDCHVNIGLGYKNALAIEASVAPSTPAQITAACTPASICAPEGTATFQAGETMAIYNILGNTLGSATLRVASPGYGVRDYAVNVVAPEFYTGLLDGLTLGASTDAIVQLRSYFQQPGCSFSNQVAALPMQFQLSSSNPAIATVPNSITMAVNTGQVTFPVSALSPGTATITVTFPGIGTQSFEVMVAP